MAAKDAKLELKGAKWHVEYFKGKKDVVVEATDNKQSVYIYGCTADTIVTVKGKVTSIAVDNCKKTSVIFDNVIATFEVVNSTGIQGQVNTSVPSITIDKSHGVKVYLQSAEGKKTEIVTSASTEINIITPGANADADPVEQAIPFQYVSTFDANGKLITKPSEHVGV